MHDTKNDCYLLLDRVHESHTPSTQCIIRNKPVRLALMPKIARRAMPRNKRHIIAQWPQLLRDRIDQVLMIAAREIGAADAALEYHVADNRQL